jgi:glucose/arabinose dehydrogenase
MEVVMARNCRRAARLLSGILAVVLPLVAMPITSWADVTARPVLTGLDQPVGFTFGPGRTLWYVEKATGEIHVVDLATGRDRLFYRVPGVNAEGERGLLGIALHPDYPSRPWVYVYVTRRAHGELRNRILRIREEDGVGVARREIFSAPVGTRTNHNGGRILFGPDGMLYAVVGDGADPATSQDLTGEDRGKLLRMTPAGDVPPTNPTDARWFAYGLRNSFGFAFDPRTGRLWETDNGPECNDEVNLIREGGNYGWGPTATCEGAAPRNTNHDGPDPILPELYLQDTVGITGIAFCEGCGLGPRSEGAAFFGAVNDGRIRRATLTDRRTGIRRVRSVYDHPRGVISIEVGPRGRLYFSDMTGIYRLVRT